MPEGGVAMQAGCDFLLSQFNVRQKAWQVRVLAGCSVAFSVKQARSEELQALERAKDVLSGALVDKK